MGAAENDTAGLGERSEDDGIEARRARRAEENRLSEQFITELAQRLAAQPRSVRDWRRD
ncbi:hypothetical protein HJD18_12235 [Thermoleophilia bacterium SCSIO 60948]|nr:hypothetical protein HJD18_12235 [Thermoleophilia bacterium SCSIO 60948]